MTHIGMVLRAALRQTFSGMMASLLAGVCLAQPSVKLAPKSGPPTTNIKVSGSGFAAYAAVDIYIGSTDVALALANGSGAFSGIVIQIPASALPGDSWINAVQRSTDTGAQTAFLVETNWSQFGFTSKNQRNNMYENVLSQSNAGSIDVQWSYATGGPVYSSPAVVDGVVYVNSSDGNVYALNAATGALKWKFATGTDAPSTSPAVADGIVFVTTPGCSTTCEYGNSLLALNATTGALLWSYTPPSLTGASSPAVANGVVFFGGASTTGDSPNLFAVAASSTFTSLWSWTSPLASEDWFTVPAVANGVAYAIDWNGADNLYYLNAATGSLLQTVVFGVESNFTPKGGVTVSDGALLFGNGESYTGIIAVNDTTGIFLWTLTTSGNVNSPLALSNHWMYFGEGNNVQAVYVEDNTGFTQWTLTTGGEVISAPAVANGVVYVGSSDGNLYALLSDSGAVLWNYATGGSVYSSPAVVNGVVYVGSADNNVYAFSLAGGQQVRAAERPALNSLHPDPSLEVSQPTTTPRNNAYRD